MIDLKAMIEFFLQKSYDTKLKFKCRIAKKYIFVSFL